MQLAAALAQFRHHLARQNHFYAHAQPVRGAQALKEPQRVLALDLVNRGDAIALHLRQRALDEGAGEVFVRILNDAVDEVGGLFLLQNARRLALAVAQDSAVGRVGRLPRDACPLQGQRVDPEQVTILAPQGDGMFGRGGIQRGAGGEVAARPLVLVPAPALNPLARRSLRSALAHQFRHLVLALACGGVNVVGAMGRAEQVDMRVDEAGQHGTPAQVDDARVQAAAALYLIVAANGQDAPAGLVNRHCLRAWLRGIHGNNIAIHIEKGTHTFSCSRTKLIIASANSCGR